MISPSSILKKQVVFLSSYSPQFASQGSLIAPIDVFMNISTQGVYLLILYRNFIMSESSRRKKALALQELHLSPEVIYLVHDETLASDASYTLELWKNQTLVTVTQPFIKSQPCSTHKYSRIEFKGIRFVFDVQALFQSRSSTTIELKLRQTAQKQQTIVDEFELHLFYYNFQFSRERFVKRRQNSIGKINHNIINYSFSAIYGGTFKSLMFDNQAHRRQEVLLKDLHFDKKNLRYGQILQQNSNQTISTIFLIEAVAEAGTSNVQKTNNLSLLTAESPTKVEELSTNTEIPDDSDEETFDARKVMRSIMDEQPNQFEDSNIIDHQLVNGMVKAGKRTIYWITIILCFLMIYLLMHPINRI